MLKLFLIWVIGAATYFVVTLLFIKLDEMRYSHKGFAPGFFSLWIISIPLWFISVPVMIGVTLWNWCWILLMKLGLVKEPQQP